MLAWRAMDSLYDVAAAADLVASLADSASEALALRTYTARLVGRQPSLVLHGGGNTSVKTTATTILCNEVEVIHVKGSGWDLGTIEPAGHPAVRLESLRKLRALTSMTDEAMVNELRTNLLDAAAPNPSVETLLHAFLPARFIDHTHADAILALCDQPGGEAICRSVFGPGLVWIPYVMPGFALAKSCIDHYERVAATTTPTVMVLEKHGLFTWGETAQESYERTIEAVTRAERHAGKRTRPGSVAAPHARVSDVDVLPRLRGALARLGRDAAERGPIVRLRSTSPILAFLARADAPDLVEKGCATPDHVLRTKPTALFIRDPAYGDSGRLTAQLEEAIEGYARAYDAYFDAMSRAKGVSKKKLDPWPRVVLLPGLGVCAIGSTARETDIALDIYEHTIDVMAAASAVGQYEPCARADLFDVEYWSLEQAKLKPPSREPLSRAVALVTGAASGIGRATAARLVASGAHVAMLDRDGSGLTSAAETVAAGKADRVLPIPTDVLDGGQVRAALGRVVREWGGVDVVVSNAGTAPQGMLDTDAGEAALRASLEINALSHLTVARAAVDVMTTQGHGGCLLFNASKAAFNPGPGFGPYAVAKASLVALTRQYAIDLAPRGIRSNAVNADRIRTQLFAGGVLESRAQARGLSVDDYFRSNLLAREVTADDVADAFVYLATARATTGCIVTVDGGNASAFPR
jgi:rhamnose utilization protein RhaD (predicted bifunctional aldolase and dehydrogenase)/NAD(P)-dependent dehydrogenase (short-subunit alcohol dehydrogenase family)